MLEPVTAVHRFDQRGCGGSEDTGDHTMGRAVADVEALRRHWGHDRWIVIGHSFGATLALEYAFAHPGRTAAVGYLSGVGVGDWRAAYRDEWMRRTTVAQRERLAELEAGERSAREETEFRTLCWFTDHADPGDGRRWAAEDARAGFPINWAANRALMAGTRPDADVLARARELDLPCWFVHGDRDPRPSGTVRALAGVVPGARFRLIAGAGHHPWRERPGDLRQVLRELVADQAK